MGIERGERMSWQEGERMSWQEEKSVIEVKEEIYDDGSECVLHRLHLRFPDGMTVGFDVVVDRNGKLFSSQAQSVNIHNMTSHTELRVFRSDVTKRKRWIDSGRRKFSVTKIKTK